MQVPFHALIIHFPLAIAFLLPFLVLTFAYMIKINKMTPQGWLIVVGLQLVLTITGYVSLESGETEERRVKQVVAKELVHEHEEAAEIFVGSTVLALVVSIAVFFIRREFQFPIKVGIAVLGFISCYLAYQTGLLGGELVYQHNAASAYSQEGSHGYPASAFPSGNVLGGETPSEENESLKPDENDYGQAGEGLEGESDDFKQED